MTGPGTIRFLGREDVRAELGLADCLAAVEAAFTAHARGAVPCAPGVLAAHVAAGGFHVKTAGLGSGPLRFAAKINANFTDNPARHGLPAIQGLIVLFDADCGTPLAVMDSIEITILRTAAATALAARHLAAPEAGVVTICGCGSQGESHLRALALVRPIRRAFAVDRDPARARGFAVAMERELAIEVVPEESLARAVAASDLCVTCTPSRQPFFSAAMLHPGLFIAAVGADSPDKQEMEPEVLRRCRVVTDLTGQAAAIGELHHVVAAGLMTTDGVFAELGQVLAGERPGRQSRDEMFLFDSTGTALQDAAAAALVYERACRSGRGTTLTLTRRS
jgi:ornithine cyclodeaminase/alanine dehydrogenase-like protein (mu-crystallin family)